MPSCIRSALGRVFPCCATENSYIHLEGPNWDNCEDEYMENWDWNHRHGGHLPHHRTAHPSRGILRSHNGGRVDTSSSPWSNRWFNCDAVPTVPYPDNVQYVPVPPHRRGPSPMRASHPAPPPIPAVATPRSVAECHLPTMRGVICTPSANGRDLEYIPCAVPITQSQLALTPMVQTTTLTPMMPAIQHTPMVQQTTFTPVVPQRVLTPIMPTTPLVSSGITWVPHPLPHPSIPATSFWQQNMLGDARSWCPTPLDNNATMRLTGGWPLPGTAPMDWTPVWPAARQLTGLVHVPVQICPWLVPNPRDPNRPHVVWDVSQDPMTAKRITGRNIVTPLSIKFNDDATFPPVDTLHIIPDVGLMGLAEYWGPIVVKSKKVTLADVMYAIFEYFQAQMTQGEVNRVCQLSHENYHSLCDSYHRRIRYSSCGTREWERRHGLKRVDCLGTGSIFWGMWVTYNTDNTWQLNLGLVPRSY